jgi:hypothetical protein
MRAAGIVSEAVWIEPTRSRGLRSWADAANVSTALQASIYAQEMSSELTAFPTAKNTHRSITSKFFL